MALRIYQQTSPERDTLEAYGRHWKPFGTDNPTPAEVLVQVQSAAEQDEHLLLEDTSTGRRWLATLVELPLIRS